MAIADEITRIQTAKADLKTSINAKTDSSHQITNELIDDYADFVDSISGGDISEYIDSTLQAGSNSLGRENWALSVKKLPPLTFSGTNFANAFYGFNGEEIDLSNVSISSNVTNISNCFSGCKNITELDLSNWNTSNVINMEGVFNSCENITELDLSNWNTSNSKKFNSMFYGCRKLETINISSFNFEEVTGDSSSSQIGSMFANCSLLTNLMFGTNLGKGYTGSAHSSYAKLQLNNTNSLTHDSLMSVINNLYDISDKNTQDLQLGSFNLGRLTPEEIAIATAKNWTVS